MTKLGIPVILLGFNILIAGLYIQSQDTEIEHRVLDHILSKYEGTDKLGDLNLNTRYQRLLYTLDVNTLTQFRAEYKNAEDNLMSQDFGPILECVLGGFALMVIGGFLLVGIIDVPFGKRRKEVTN